MKTHSTIPMNRFQHSYRSRINPIRSLTPQSLIQILDAFHSGHLASAALAWESIERHDDILKGVAAKRKKSVSRLRWRVHPIDDSPEVLEHKKALEHFYNNITATHACDNNQLGGFSLLVRQMMDAIGKQYAVHEIVYKPNGNKLTACFRFVPLWFFQNKSGKLRFLKSDSASDGIDLEEGAWLRTTGDGLMEACSIAYLFKQLPLRDWLVYCERNGMPGVKGITDATLGTSQCESARYAVLDFGAEFHALLSRGTDIESIDLTAKGQLPYPALVERMDRSMTALWRGSDLSILSQSQATGASVQSEESALIEQDDAALISETLNIQVDRYALKYLFGAEKGKAYIQLEPNNHLQTQRSLDVYERLMSMGLSVSEEELRERFGVSTTKKETL